MDFTHISKPILSNLKLRIWDFYFSINIIDYKWWWKWKLGEVVLRRQV